MVQQITTPQNSSEGQHIFFVGREYEQQMYASFLAQDTPWLLLITGVPGSGKSALVDRLKVQTEQQKIPVLLLNFAQPWLRTDILTILEKLAAQLQPYSSGTSQFQQKLKRSRQSFSKSDTKISRMVLEAEQADREQLQWVSQAREAYRDKERAEEDTVKAFYHLVEAPQLTRLVIILDASEWLYEPGDRDVSRVGKWIMNRFLPGLHQRMQEIGKGCHVVLTSRECISLEKVREQERKEYILPPLDQAAVEEYLRQKGMQDKAQREQVYRLSLGHPFSMMLIAELWEMRRDQPLPPADFLYEQEELNIPALLAYLRGWLLEKQPTDLFTSFLRYGVLLRDFELPMLQEVFREFLGEVQEQAQFTRLTSAPYILRKEELYAFHDLMHEMFAPYIRIHEPDKWQMYHERAWKYLTKLATFHGTAYPVNGYYHVLAFNEKRGLEEWRHAVKKAYQDGKREVLAALFLVAFDKTLELSLTTRASIAYEQGRYYYTDQQWDQALKSTRLASDLYREARDAAGQARACVGIANVLRFRPARNLRAALIYYQQAYDLYLSIDDGGVDCYLNQARRLYEIGEVLRLQKKLDKALESYNDALKIFQAFDYYRDMAYVHRSIGDALVHLSPDQKKDAIEHFEQALVLLPGEEDPAARAEMYEALGNLRRECQNWTGAAKAYEQGLHFWQQDDNLAGQARICQSLGDVKKKIAQESVALDSYRKALKLYAQHEQRLSDHSAENADYVTIQARKIDIYWAINQIKENLHEYEEALENCQKAEKIYDAFGDQVKAKVTKQMIDDTISRIIQTKTEWTRILYESDRKVDKGLVNALIDCVKRRDHIGAAYTCQNIAQVLWGNSESLQLIKEAYHRARWNYGEVGDDGGQAYTAQKIGEIEKILGDTDAALKAYHDACWFYGKVGDDKGQAYATQQIAEIQWELGHLQAALEAYYDARWFYGKVSDQPGQAYISQRMGELEYSRGNIRPAMGFLDDACKYYCQAGDKKGKAYILRLQGEIEEDIAQWPEAQKHFEAARAIYHQELKDRLAEAYLCRMIGDVLLAQQQWEMARQSYNQAMSLYEQGEMPYEKARIYWGRSKALRKCGKFSLALQDYEECARLYQQIDKSGGEATAERRAVLEILQIMEHERSAGKQPLPAFVRIKWENNEQAVVGKEYTLQVCPGQKPLEESDGEETTAESSVMESQLVISIELDIDGSVISQEQKKQIRYNPREPRWIGFPFSVMEAGDHILKVAFIHKRWLGTISFEFKAVEQPHDLVSAQERWTEKRLILPLHDKFRVDVSLYIRAEGNRFTLEVISDRGAFGHFPMNIIRDDLRDFNQGLQTAIENVLEEVGQVDFDEKLSILRERGNYVWRRIFSGEGAPEFIREALKPGATIQIVVDKFEEFNIPWELLYDGHADTEEVDIFHFWGMRYHVIRSLQSQKYPPEVIHAVRPTIGIIRNRALRGAEAETGGFEDMEGITVELLRDLDEDRHFSELKHLIQFLNDKELHILHLACEASTEDSGNRYLWIADNFHIDLEEIYDKFRIRHYPLVVLNACGTGILDPSRTSNWVILFWEQGAGGIVATEARVPDEFAARFSREFYKHLLDEKQIGEALFEARRFFWEQPEGHPEHNPIGLVYSLYSSPSLRIEKTFSD